MVRLPAEPELERVHPQAAGIDIGASEHWVSIPAELDPEPVRKFSCFTADLYAMAEWLNSLGITTVAMESTGVY
jgi:transposase